MLRTPADGKIHASGKILTLLVDELAMTEEECSRLLPSGRSCVLNDHISWTGTYLKRAGLIESPKRGTYHVTRPDREAPASGAQIDNNYLERYESFRPFKNLNGGSSAHTAVDDGLEKKSEVHLSEETPDEALNRAFLSINVRLADDLLSEVLKLSSIALERLVLSLVAKTERGAFDSASQVTPISEDEGVDGTIMENKLDFGLIYAQVKRYTEDKTVGRSDIQTFVGATTGRGGKGLFVTTARFTEKAITYAKRQHIILIDGHKFAQLIIGHGFDVNTRKTCEIRAVDGDVFNEYVDEEQ